MNKNPLNLENRTTPNGSRKPNAYKAGTDRKRADPYILPMKAEKAENGQNTKPKRAYFSGCKAADFTPETLTKSGRNTPETNGFLKIITISY